MDTVAPFGVDVEAISEVIDVYFRGLHNADLALLTSIFDKDCCLVAPGVRLSLHQWLDKVAHRPVPAQQKSPSNYRIVAIDVQGDQAMVKAYCPLLGAEYLDFLGLLRDQGQWKIVSKMYADVPL